MRVLAALATIPSRERFLPRVLASLRPQVDVLCVYLNTYTDAPACVRELADHYVCDPENKGAEAKLFWSNKPSFSPAEDDGFFYLSCDDDLVYPPNYADTMCREVDRWSGRAIVTCHGRVYRPDATHWSHVIPSSVGLFYKRVNGGWWVNYSGTGVMAFHTGRVPVPNQWSQRNILDAQLAVWAQRERVPMWLAPHDARWIKPLALIDPSGIFRSSCRESHARRGALISSTKWELHSLS